MREARYQQMKSMPLGVMLRSAKEGVDLEGQAASEWEEAMEALESMFQRAKVEGRSVGISLVEAIELTRQEHRARWGELAADDQ